MSTATHPPSFIPARSAFVVLFLGSVTLAGAVPVTVTVENLAAENGAYLTPVWVAAHSGLFDTFDVGSAASAELERLAEDGNLTPLSGLFAGSSDGFDGAVFGQGGPLAPGEIARFTLELDPENLAHRFFSYGSMLIPSNDAFIANDNPTAHPIFDELGSFHGGSWVVYGSDVYDAGTEINDELPASTAFFGQMAPDTGAGESGLVSPHPGLRAAGAGGIVDDPMFAEADFSAFGRRVARITISAATKLSVSIKNLAPTGGNFLTPPWIGVHDGDFDLYDRGAASSAGLERLAEDGNTAPLAGQFQDSGAGAFEATIPGPAGPLAPGETATLSFEIDGTLPASRYLSFASMIIPSNDAFIANDDPRAFPLFDDRGQPRLGTYLVYGNDALDAGTEINDELPANTAFFGQATPDTGVVEGGRVALHPGLLPAGSGGIVDDPAFAASSFTSNGYAVAEIKVTAEGDPAIRLQNRFRIFAETTDFGGDEIATRGFAVSDQSAFLYFLGPENVEILVKVLDGCDVNGRYWVFASGLTNLGVDLSVEDLEAGQSWTVATVPGETFEPVLDTAAFATCP